jgi:hypothetical protein
MILEVVFLLFWVFGKISDDEIKEVEKEAVVSRVKVKETFYKFQARHHTRAYYLNAGMGEKEAMAKAIANSTQSLKRRLSIHPHYFRIL